MGFESISGDAENNQSNGGGISRRTVIKAGAHAAWAVPLVQVVAAAPAIAVSGSCTLSITKASGKWPGGSGKLNVSVTVAAATNATSGLQVTLVFTEGWQGGKAAASGWGVTGPTPTTPNTYVFTANTQIAAGGTATLTAQFTPSGAAGAAAKIDVSATALNSSNAPGTQIPVAANPRA